MILGNAFGEERVPFARPASATPNFMPGRMQTGFIPEFQPPFASMKPQFAHMPAGVMLPPGAGPGSMPAAAAASSAVTASTASLPAAAAKIRRGGRMFSPDLIMALGVQSNMRARVVDPSGLVAAGRKSGL